MQLVWTVFESFASWSIRETIQNVHWQIKYIEWCKTIVSTTLIQPSFSFVYYILTLFRFFLIMQLEEMSTQFTVDKKEMEERHTLVQKMVCLTCTLWLALKKQLWMLNVKTIITDYWCIDHPFINSDV